MNKSNNTLSDDSLKEINNIFHPMGDGSYFINHNCFLVDNHIVIRFICYLITLKIQFQVSSHLN